MLSRRALLTLILLLPIAAQANIDASASKKRHHRQPQAEAASSDQAKHPASKKTSKPARHAEPAEKTPITPVAEKRPQKRTAEQRAEKKEAAPKQRHTAPEVKTASAPSNDEPTVVTRGSTAASRLSTRAIDAIPPVESSLYDRRNAHVSAPSESGIFSKWFGPKSDGVRYDSRMIQAAQIAETRARAHSVRACWRYVKEALLAANVVDTYPQTALAKQAGDELINRHGFRRLSITDPFKAPVGSVLVYGGPGAGHVEIRTTEGFVSDFESPTPSKRPLLGVFVKPS